MVYYTDWGHGRCVVCLSSLVLSVYSVQHRRKFLLACYAYTSYN